MKLNEMTTLFRTLGITFLGIELVLKLAFGVPGKHNFSHSTHFSPSFSAGGMFALQVLALQRCAS